MQHAFLYKFGKKKDTLRGFYFPKIWHHHQALWWLVFTFYSCKKCTLLLPWWLPQALFCKGKKGFFLKAPIWNSTAYNLGFLTRRFLLLLLLQIDFVPPFSKNSRQDWQDIKFWHLFNLNLIKNKARNKEVSWKSDNHATQHVTFCNFYSFGFLDRLVS